MRKLLPGAQGKGIAAYALSCTFDHGFSTATLDNPLKRRYGLPYLRLTGGGEDPLYYCQSFRVRTPPHEQVMTRIPPLTGMASDMVSRASNIS